jgi:hypothetical protein
MTMCQPYDYRELAEDALLFILRSTLEAPGAVSDLDPMYWNTEPGQRPRIRPEFHTDIDALVRILQSTFGFALTWSIESG